MPGGGKYSNYPDTLGPSPYNPAGGRGASDPTLLKTLFAQPTTGDQLTETGVAATANRELCPDVLPANPDPMIYSVEDIALGFGNAPDIEKGPFNPNGANSAGDPANPYFPNLASPDPSGGGSTAPVKPTNLTSGEVSKTAVQGVNGLVDPSVTSGELSNATKITGVPLPLGKGPGGV